MSNNRNSIRSLAPAALVAAGLGLGLVLAPMLTPTVAYAQDDARPTTEPPFNATADRKALITQLTDVNARLGRIEAKLASGINVKVTEMPASAAPSK